MQITQQPQDGFIFCIHNPNSERDTTRLVTRLYQALLQRCPEEK